MQSNVVVFLRELAVIFIGKKHNNSALCIGRTQTRINQKFQNWCSRSKMKIYQSMIFSGLFELSVIIAGIAD